MNPGAPLVVADTNVMSHMFRQDALGVRYLELLEDVDVVISFQRDLYTCVPRGLDF